MVKTLVFTGLFSYLWFVVQRDIQPGLRFVGKLGPRAWGATLGSPQWETGEVG